MQKVRKAVLPVAGLGTRFLPATKSMPKEMLTVVDKPIIQYVVEEALAAGIEEFVFITGRGKQALEDHFDRPYELADTLEKRGKMELLDKVLNILPSHVRVFYTRQGQPLGLGHAVQCAHSVIGDEPFAVLLPDDLLCGSKENALGNMIKLYEETNKPVVLVENVPADKTVNYGILDLGGKGVIGNRAEAVGFVEKPHPDEAPSNLGIVGRYVLTPRIFDFLSKEKPGKGGEIQLTDAMNSLCAEQGFMGHVYEGQRFDCGDKVGWQMANLYFAMKDPYIAPRLLPYLHTQAAAFERRTTPRS
ncbi:MAG: UTP--glucose-1-phosphate uridylyltransferase GalU [Alphaproteobacteria bacterium]